jgi:hypothetical protein
MGTVGKAPTQTSPAAEKAVAETVKRYCKAIHNGETRLLAEAFYPTATLFGWDEGELRRVTLEHWFRLVDSIPSPESTGALRDGEILSIDICGTAAVVKVKESYRKLRYMDYLSLLHTGERWQVMHKSYHQYSDLPPRG